MIQCSCFLIFFRFSQLFLGCQISYFQQGVVNVLLLPLFVCLLSDLCALRELLWVALVVQLQSLQSATTEFWKLFRQPGQFPDNLGSFQIILNISRWPGKFPLQNVAKIVYALFYAKFLRGKVWQLESFYFLGLWLTKVHKVVTQRASVGANNRSSEIWKFRFNRPRDVPTLLPWCHRNL